MNVYITFTIIYNYGSLLVPWEKMPGISQNFKSLFPNLRLEFKFKVAYLYFLSISKFRVISE